MEGGLCVRREEVEWSVSGGIWGEVSGGGDECVRKGALEGARCFFKVLGQPRGEPSAPVRMRMLAYSCRHRRRRRRSDTGH